MGADTSAQTNLLYFFYWGIIDVQYYISYKCTIYWFTIFKGFTPFIVIIKYWLYFLYYKHKDTFILIACFIRNSLYLIISYHYIAPPPSPLPFGNHWLVLLEKAMAPHSRALAWKIPWAEEPGRLQSMGSLGVRHNWTTSLSLCTFMHWRRQWHPTPGLLPGKSHGWRSLVGCSPWGR